MPTPARRHQLRYDKDISKAWCIPMAEVVSRIALSYIGLECAKPLTREMIVPTNGIRIREITLRKETHTVG